ncbi:PREDICTED: sulfotransferase 6B1-like [Nanorana parkeri]|uniref:sulfotransferase 6B1-like n=1 Tax=Nanorana parkeri TaxID=125878 RepID=UPI000853F81A|nr:PREDICTED: sulfotransferase 6B1-like [Nanorana parkeri]
MDQLKQTVDREAVLNLLQAPNKPPEELLLNYKGILYPGAVCSKELFEALETFEARNDDLLICSSPKCGTNWVFQILSEMVSILKNKETVLDQLTLEFGNLQLFESNKARPSPRIFSTHLRFPTIPKSFFEKNTKILLVIRNPKDAATSYYRFHKSLPALPTYDSWDLFFKDYMHGNVCYGSYFDYVAEWNKHIDGDNVMAITFEEMKTDLLAQLKTISEFYRLPLTEEQLCEVERRTSFASMKQKSEGTHGKLSEAFFRKGQVGDWKNLFTEEQSKEMDEKFQQKLAGTKLGDLLNYEKYCKF